MYKKQLENPEIYCDLLIGNEAQLLKFNLNDIELISIDG